MKQWDIALFPFGSEGPHPAVILSNSDRCADARATHINALLCVTKRGGRLLAMDEVMLDRADGLDWETVVRCDPVYLLPKAQFGDLRGQVSIPRRRLISKRIIASLRLQPF